MDGSPSTSPEENANNNRLGVTVVTTGVSDFFFWRTVLSLFTMTYDNFNGFFRSKSWMRRRLGQKS